MSFIQWRMERLRKKGKGQYEGNMTDVCEKGFHMGKEIDTENLELAEQRNMMRGVVANSSFISLSLRARIPNLPLRKNRCLKVVSWRWYWATEYIPSKNAAGKSDSPRINTNDNMNILQGETDVHRLFENQSKNKIIKNEIKYRINPTANSSTYIKLNKFSEETSSKKQTSLTIPLDKEQ